MWKKAERSSGEFLDRFEQCDTLVAARLVIAILFILLQRVAPNHKAVPTCVTSSAPRREANVIPEICSAPVAVPSSSAENPTCVLIEMTTSPNSVRRVNQSVSSP